ncbi:MAG: amino acid permease [Clostridia bacterium]|nr:amino acid permease [Clostridia bacterium]
MGNADKKSLRPYLSPLAVWAFSIGTSVGWGSLVVTANTYLSQAGPLGTTLGMMIGMIIMLLIGYNYAYLINSSPESGGSYAFVRNAFGHDHGFLISWFLSLTYLAVLWANATSLPLFARYFLGGVFQFGKMYTLFGYDVYIGEALLSIAAILLFCFLVSRHQYLMAATNTVTAIIFFGAIALCFAVAMVRRDAALIPAAVPDKNALGQIIRIACISPWAFIGFENISHFSEEYTFERKRVFRILVWSIVCSTLVYVFVSLLSVTAYPPEYSSWLEYIRDIGNLTGIKGLPAFYAAEHYLGQTGITILMIALMCLIITSLIGNITALSRLFYAMGRDGILSERSAVLNQKGVPENAIPLIALVSSLVPFVGRSAIGWIVDVTTIGATLTYGYVSGAAMVIGKREDNRKAYQAGKIGVGLMMFFSAYLLLPNFVGIQSMEKESYFLFMVWALLGYVFFRSVLHRDKNRRYGQTVVVRISLLSLIILISMIWMRQSMVDSNRNMMEAIHAHYETSGEFTPDRQSDEAFVEEQLEKLNRENTRTVLTATVLFASALIVMLSNYSYMNKQTRENEKIANTDSLTGVKSKHAYLKRENEMDSEIQHGSVQPFAVALCDVNELKVVNDTMGHKAGDTYICDACHMICHIFDHSPVYRIGGDEFAVILTGSDFEDRANLIQQVHIQSLENQKSGKVVVAVGISDYIQGQDLSIRDVFERADAMMYGNKQELKASRIKS